MKGKKVSKSSLNFPWLIKMALRDSRKNKSRLFLFISSIVLGIAAMVAISSFRDNLMRDIDRQAASLIGADLVLDSRKVLSDSSRKLIDSLKDLSVQFAEEKNFVSMVYFEKSGGSRLVQIRGISGEYPFYGKIETIPQGAADHYQNENTVLVDKTLMLQFDAEVGDTVRIGNSKFRIEGESVQAPGQTGLSSAVAPAIFLPLASLESTGLLQKGSRVNYLYYYQFDTNVDSHQLAERLDERLEKEGLDAESVQMRKERTGRVFGDLTKFLSLVGFIALLLGCIGVSSAVQIYIREKINSIAILRCLGVSGFQAFLIFIFQIIGIGFIGSIIGAGLGVLLQQLIPMVLAELLPVEVNIAVSWPSIWMGVVLGVLISVLFALLPLLSVQRVSPLNTLRASFQATAASSNKQRGFVFLLIVLFIATFARTQLDDWLQTLIFTIAVVAGYLILYGVAAIMIRLVRKYFPNSWAYVWRQGLSNLYRPNNQTVILVMAIGLGTAFISTLFFVKSLLIEQVTFSTQGEQPNMVLFDIQTRQKDEVTDLVRLSGLPVIQEVPIVTIQLESINGYRQSDVEKDSTLEISTRAFARELRVTFRDSLISSEKITEGSWKGIVAEGDTALISLDREYAERIGVQVGDEIVCNVQGLLVPTRVGSLREVDWDRVQTNFRIVFPKGIIDDAPQFHVIMTRTPNEETSAAFQLKLVQAFPNVSIIDLKLILTVLDEIISKVSFVIQFMAALSIFTGLVVLLSSILISKFQRIQESVLLRTLGASRKQVLAITALEYFFLGALSSMAGILIAVVSAWALATFNFEIPFRPDFLVILVVLVCVTFLTVIIGIININSILRRPPLEILRR
ncbi:ABC transporter permease [Albibacterium indicum]|uniref:ABC transporter permease n=1 Tax=Albibacterium indicum TaxID=2292082 RepID=UPI00198184DF|nr:FtsX-like permease family protein [Pedobacter indicus]